MKGGKNGRNTNYYEEKLHSQLLLKIYDTSLPRVSQYLKSEIEFVKEKLTGEDRVLEIG